MVDVTAHMADSPQPAVRRVAPSELGEVLAQGVADFREKPSHLYLLALIYPLIGLFAARMAGGYEVLPLLYPLVAGFALVGPVAAVGFSEISRQRERGQPVSWMHAFGVLGSRSIGAIFTLALGLVAVFLAWLAAADAIFQATLGPEQPTSLAVFAEQLFGTPEGWRLIVIGNLVGFLFALLVLVTTVVSFPLLLDRPVSAWTAVRTSLRVTARNPVTVAAWGLIVAALLLVGSIPFFVGLAVVVPVLGHATWHLYRKAVQA